MPQGSILGPLFFLIYIYDFPDNVTSNTKIITDDASLFSVVHDVNNFKIELNDDLKTFNEYSIGK